MTNTVTVEVKFKWEIPKQEWLSAKEFFSEEEVAKKLNYDPVDMFYHLRQMSYPEVKEVKVLS